MSGIKAGSHVAIAKMGGIYDHHAIYIGDGQVIEYGGLGGGRSGKIRYRSYDDFKGQGRVVVVDSEKSFSGKEIVERAKSRIGEDDYDVVFNNCEHFANWCRSGNHVSDQVTRAPLPFPW